MELVLVLFQVRKSCADYETTQTVPNEREPSQLGTRAAFSDVLVNFLSESPPHLENIHVCVVLISLGTEEKSIWQSDRYYVFEHANVKTGALEPVAKDK